MVTQSIMSEFHSALDLIKTGKAVELADNYLRDLISQFRIERRVVKFQEDTKEALNEVGSTLTEHLTGLVIGLFQDLFCHYCHPRILSSLSGVHRSIRAMIPRSVSEMVKRFESDTSVVIYQRLKSLAS